ncbi:hypothetical protein CPC735_025190 [Coccidioides posadasii C735 delta SOWgp]|uniref:UDENN domain-containing protein n=1 Tax=Coccidioides posadasii (strain C735) TaxID=222929 RepID=C5P6Y3_COCP7|nr:hypothetical protein CPC735_025190 [Coccidioides posadasii C735 delta SOWgp]EER27183.1 hypothetical protein CPC735_025190 [Coccidioides posadasii C735 delta SOWgp]|eukprot:XP_003069328.1 hypothetical protein CPC735_025190 [Coccidioides posadasii C735 delta SOWgp]
MATSKLTQEPILLVVDFHHARGPEVELSFCEDGTDPVGENDWSLLPFMALSDGAHASMEDFSYFTLQRNATTTAPPKSLFGISCTRQIDSSSLINRPPEVTRSTVQKAVVIIIDEPKRFGQLREKLSMVTSAWFAQRDFSDTDILKKFWESLRDSLNNEAQKDHHLGLSLRAMIHEFKHQTLVLFKCLLLQPKMLFFGTRCERLCMIQFSLISLIPGLLDHLEDCADPSFDNYSQTVEKPTSLKTSERSSLLAYMGLPLQIFGKGSMFGPYTPLQQLDLLADYGTKSYLVGSTNSLLLQQKDRYSDILINLDEDNITISSPSLRSALSLTAADRRWIDFLTQTINETWDEAHPDRPKTHGYLGSEEFIRLQFEEYLLALLSSMKYHEQVASQVSLGSPKDGPKSPGFQSQATDIEGDPALDFNIEFLERWQTTSNYALFNRLTSDALLYSIVEPRHPCAGGLGIEDIQRRLAQQMSDLHLDERMREGREALNKHLATGQKKVTAAFNSLWADIEAIREAQRKKNEEKTQNQQQMSPENQKPLDNEASPRPSLSSIRSPTTSSWGFASRKPNTADFSQAQATVAAAGQRASAYFSSWSSWANERRKEWQEKKANTDSHANSVVTSPAGTPRASTSMNNPPDITDPIELSNMGRQGSRTSNDSGSELSRSSSTRKRWSNILRKHDSCDSISSTKGLPKNDTEPPASPLSDSLAKPQDVSIANPDKATLSYESLNRSTIPSGEHSLSQPENRQSPEEPQEAPTPVLQPSDKLQSHHSRNEEPAISPLVLDDENPNDAFTNVDLSSSSQGAMATKNETSQKE